MTSCLPEWNISASVGHTPVPTPPSPKLAPSAAAKAAAQACAPLLERKQDPVRSEDDSIRRRSLSEGRPGMRTSNERSSVLPELGRIPSGDLSSSSSCQAETVQEGNQVILGASLTGGHEVKEMVLPEQEMCSMLMALQDQHWRVRTADLEILLRPDGSDWLLGTGAHARLALLKSFNACCQVYRGILNNSIPVAIKALDDDSPSAKQNFVEEIVCLMTLRHANIVQFYGALIEEDNMLLIMELMHRGSLYDVIARDSERQTGWYNKGQKIAIDIVRGVMHMHRMGYAHQDLKSRNILLSSYWVAKVSDIGLFGSVSGKHIRLGRRAAVGTFEWTAPEVLNGGLDEVTFASDIYSLGVLLAEIITGEEPHGRSFDLEVPAQCPQEVADLVLRCVDDNRLNRPSIEEILNYLMGQRTPRTRPLISRRLSGLILPPPASRSDPPCSFSIFSEEGQSPTITPASSQ